MGLNQAKFEVLIEKIKRKDKCMHLESIQGKRSQRMHEDLSRSR